MPAGSLAPRPQASPAARRALWLICASFGLAIVAAFAAFVLAQRPASAATSAVVTAHPAIIGRASVIDADTIEIHGTRIRLDGIDAPESGQRCRNPAGVLARCGAAAANALDAFLAARPVTCIPTGLDRYKRQIARCEVGGADIGAWLVSSGNALAFRKYSLAYVATEDRARLARVGVWAQEFISPWDWRKGERLPGEKPTKSMLERLQASQLASPSG
jgi:endonuclease YncB( thermonuclease family)